MTHLTKQVASNVLAELGTKLAPVDNAPHGVIRSLAHHNEIAVAGPVLVRSTQLSDSDLIEIAKTKGQGHLGAISERVRIAAAVTDILVERGEYRRCSQVVTKPRCCIFRYRVQHADETRGGGRTTGGKSWHAAGYAVAIASGIGVEGNRGSTSAIAGTSPAGRPGHVAEHSRVGIDKSLARGGRPPRLQGRGSSDRQLAKQQSVERGGDTGICNKL